MNKIRRTIAAIRPKRTITLLIFINASDSARDFFPCCAVADGDMWVLFRRPYNVKALLEMCVSDSSTMRCWTKSKGRDPNLSIESLTFRIFQAGLP